MPRTGRSTPTRIMPTTGRDQISGHEPKQSLEQLTFATARMHCRDHGMKARRFRGLRLNAPPSLKPPPRVLQGSVLDRTALSLGQN